MRGVLLILILASSEALSVKDKVSVAFDMRTEFEAIGSRVVKLIQRVKEGHLASISDEGLNELHAAAKKIGGVDKFGSALGALILADMDWRGVEDRSEQQTYYDRITKLLGLATPPAGRENLVDMGTEADPPKEPATAEDCPEGYSREPCKLFKNEQDDSSAAMSSYRNSLPIEEAHSVSALFLFYTAFWFYLFANNIAGLNSSSGGKPTVSADLFKMSSLTTISSQAPPKGKYNPITQTSCSSGNFFLGFGVTALLLAIAFAPPQQRQKLLAAAMLALTAGAFPGQDDASGITKSDYTSADIAESPAKPEEGKK